MKLLNKTQIKTIRKMQKDLDLKVRENNNIPLDLDLSLEKYLALKTELFEFVNEIESFKYWKKNKGKSHILEEACDTLHFIFSLAIDHNVEIKQDKELIKDFDVDAHETNDLIGILDAIISDIFISKDWEELSTALMFLTVILNKAGFNSKDLYEEYLRKNQVNHERQENNY